MDNILDLSIVIVNWNVKDLLRDCLKSVYAQTKAVSFEILIVDNASSDGSAGMVEREFPQVKLIKNQENLGAAKANNQATMQAGGRYTLLLNPDVVVLDGALDKMVQFMDAHPETGALVCKLLNPDGTTQWSRCNCFPTLKTQSRVVYILYRMLNKRPPWVQVSEDDNATEVSWAIGSCMMVRSEVIAQVGLLDEQFFLFVVDTDWCYRIKQKGWKIYFLPDAQLIHYGGQSSRQFDAAPIYRYQGTYRFFRKHYGKLYATCYRVMIPFSVLAMMLDQSILYLVSRGSQRAPRANNLKLLWQVLPWSLGLKRLNSPTFLSGRR